MSEVYRYRTIKQVLNRKELLDSYLYFSELENLNDPMEGFLNVYWDVIVFYGIICLNTIYYV